MATTGAIELIPKEIEAGKARAAQTRLFQLGAILFFIVAVVISGLLFFYQQILAQDLGTVETEAARQEATIGDLADIETKVVSLQDRAAAIPNIFSERDYFSVSLSALAASKPSGVDMTGLSMQEGEREVTVNGETLNYNLLSQFLNNLTDPNLGGTLFVEAGLTSVNLDPGTGVITFTIEATIKNNGLRKPLPERSAQ